MSKNLCRCPWSGWILVLAILTATVPATAQESGPPLIEGVSEMAFLYGHWTVNPERAYLRKYQEAVWEEFKASGILDDVKAMFTEMVPADARAQAEGPMKTVMDLVSGVDWNALGEHESCWAMVMTGNGPVNVNLFRVDSKKLSGVMSGLDKILDAVVGMQSMFARVHEAPEDGPKISGLQFPGVPFGFFISSVGDVLVFANQRIHLDETLGRLANPQGTRSLNDSKRYRSSLAKLPAAEDSLLFFDVAKVTDFVLSIAESQMPQRVEGQEPNPMIEQQRRMLAFVKQHVAVVDTITSVGYTEGYRNLEASYTQLQDHAVDSIGYRLMANQPKIEGFQRFVPKDALSFSVNSGVNPSAIYEFILDFMKHNVPGGDAQVAEWEKLQKEKLGFDVNDAILSKLRGDSISVSWPGSTPNPFGPPMNASVSMIGVRDGAELAKMFSGVMEQLGKMAASQGLPISVSKAEVIEGGSFHQLMIPMLPMQPVIGFHGDYFFISNGADAVKRVTALASAPSDNILANSRYTELGLVPYTPVSKISYSNLEKSYEKMAQSFASAGMMIGMAAGMATAQIPDRGDGSKEMISNIIAKVTQILPKLAPVIAKVDYYRDRTSFTYLDTNAKAVITRKATSIRPPKKAEPKAAAEVK